MPDQEGNATVTTPPAGGGTRRAPTAALAVVLAVLGGLLTFLAPGPPVDHPTLSWWALAIMFAGAALTVFHLEWDSEAHTFSLSEVPLVLALFFANPVALVAGRLVGESAVLVAKDRQSPQKLLFNLALFLGECGVALTVFHAIDRGAPPDTPIAWVAALAAVIASDLLGYSAVAAVIRWHGQRPNVTHLVVAGITTTVANTSLALIAAALLVTHPGTMVLLGTLALVLYVAYRSYAALRQRYESLRMVYDFTRVMNESRDVASALDAILTETRKLLRAEVAQIEVKIDESQPGVARVQGRGSPVTLPARVRDDLRVTRNAVVVPRASRRSRRPWPLTGSGLRDLVAAPLLGEHGVIGVMVVANRFGEVNTFDDDDARLLATLANHAGMALENGRLVDRLKQEARDREHQALHDALTGLPNRMLFARRVTSAVNQLPADRRLALLLMDLDRFKEVNDTLGHQSGDLLLQGVAARLTATLPGRAILARLGGDEFAVAIEVDGDAEAEAIARRLRETLREPYPIGDLRIDVWTSVGLALAPDHGRNAATLLRGADVAMYIAKATGTGVAVYDPDADENSPARLALATELRHAIEAHELAVYYQPKARLSDGQIIGAEALARWHSPTRGFVPPDVFIPIAEQTGMINELTQLVLERAVEQCGVWREKGHEIGVSVNVALRTLVDQELAREVAGVLQSHRVPPTALTLEITESSVMADPARTKAVLERLSSMGVRVSIDDFGTGYSSLSHLQRLTVDEVKIDKSFVFRMASDEGDATIVRSIVQLGHNLGCTVVAEGVEDQESWDQLAATACDVAQGYFLSRPVPAAAFASWLEERAISDAARAATVPTPDSVRAAVPSDA